MYELGVCMRTSGLSYLVKGAATQGPTVVPLYTHRRSRNDAAEPEIY